MSLPKTLQQPNQANLSKDAVLGLYKRMLLIRRFEERVATLFAQGKLPGFVHLYIGQEATAVGVCSTLRVDDYITSTHRGHGHVIAKGGDVSRMMAELFGKQTGYCKGKGGSMHITDMSIGMLGANGIVSGGMPIAVGAAYGAAKIRHTDQVAVAFFGDGATNEGPFHEACNMASAWKLPVIFVCENNLFGVGTRLGRISSNEDLSARAAAYAIPAMTVDGNDVLAVRQATLQAVENARAGKGPTFLECRTWRHRGHFEGENPAYWDETERQAWLVRDPISHLGEQLTQAGQATQQELDTLDAAVQVRIDEAVSFAEASSYPAPEDALQDVYI
jgi:TPP-dependent pyruvate/acetoin dehydrogenase alpha subunit